LKSGAGKNSSAVGPATALAPTGHPFGDGL